MWNPVRKLVRGVIRVATKAEQMAPLWYPVQYSIDGFTMSWDTSVPVFSPRLFAPYHLVNVCKFFIILCKLLLSQGS